MPASLKNRTENAAMALMYEAKNLDKIAVEVEALRAQGQHFAADNMAEGRKSLGRAIDMIARAAMYIDREDENR